MSKDRVEQLVQAGIDFYGLGERENAARCWREALAARPGHRLAEEYLEQVTAELAPPAPVVEERRDPKLTELRSVVDTIEGRNPMGKAEFVMLLRERRFEEALTVMYRIREVTPDNQSVSRGIQLLKDKLQTEYLQALGNLDQVPDVSGDVSTATSDEQVVLRLLDGIVSTSDVLESSRLARLQTLRALVGLVDRRVVTLRAPRPSPPVSRPAVSTPSAPRPSAPPVKPEAHEGSFEQLFSDGTQAYLRRDYAKALGCFEECLSLRPMDKRVAHNIERLRERVS